VTASRLETFSDGVFAIAITLLVLTIAQPGDYGRLGDELLERWPALAAYVVSFLVIGVMWLNHQSIFSRLARIDRPLFYLNLGVLLTVVLLPYPTGVLGEALRRGEGAREAAVAYSLLMAVNGCCWAGLWLYASSGRRLLADSFPEEERRPATVAFTIGTVLYTLLIGVAFVSAAACLALHAALGLYYAFDPLTRRSARVAGGSTEGERP
jgi:uncharacterized membrane protein